MKRSYLSSARANAMAIPEDDMGGDKMELVFASYAFPQYGEAWHRLVHLDATESIQIRGTTFRLLPAVTCKPKN